MAMPSIIKNPQDMWTGLMYLAFGGTAVFLAWEYGMGTAARMGPGYFPTVLGALLVLFGLIAVIRAFLRPGPAVGALAWKTIALVCGATALFAFLLRPAGLVVALFTLVLVSAVASAKFRFEWPAALAMIGLVAFCCLVFVKGLGVPMPLVGSWFGG